MIDGSWVGGWYCGVLWGVEGGGCGVVRDFGREGEERKVWGGARERERLWGCGWGLIDWLGWDAGTSFVRL